jgi:hypothetical protein
MACVENLGAEGMQLQELVAHSTVDWKGNPIGVLGDLREGRRPYADARFSVSHPAFFHFVHEADNLAKAKAAEYFPDVIKTYLSGKSEDVFFHILNFNGGEPYSPENTQDRAFLISGIHSPDLLKIQQTLTEASWYPTYLESSSIATFALLRKLMKAGSLEKPLIYLELFAHESLVAVIPPQGVPVFRKIHTGELDMCEKIRDELGLKDAAASQKLLHSTTIDLSDIGHKIVLAIFPEIFSLVGDFENATGQSPGRLFFGNLPPNLNWIAKILAADLAVEVFDPSAATVMEATGVRFGSQVEWLENDPRLISLLSLMGTY